LFTSAASAGDAIVVDAIKKLAAMIDFLNIAISF
jgi:hypothetical protein